MANNDDIKYIISAVTSPTQNAETFGDGDETQPPPAETVIQLTASVVDSQGNAAPEGIDVYWQADIIGNRVLYWVPDSKGNGIPPAARDLGHSTTDANGFASILAAGRYTTITTITAYPQTPPPPPSEVVERENNVGLGVFNYQPVAFVTFNDNGTLNQPKIPKDNNKLDVPDLDGSEEQPAKQYSQMSASVPMAFSGKQPPTTNSYYIIWTLSGSDTNKRGRLIQPIKSWDGNSLEVDFPFGYLSPKNNSIAYMIFGESKGYYSQVNSFDFDGVPLARPDDLPDTLPSDSSLLPVMLDTGVDNADSDKRHYIVPIPNRALTYDDLDSAALVLRLAIPAPQLNGKDNYRDNDIIRVTAWLNGWLPDGDTETMQTRILNFNAKTGEQFVKNYGTDGKTYLPITIPYSKVLENFCGSNAGYPGYMWIMYTYNGTNSLQPRMNGLYPVRIDFTPDS
ncbi:hypothetical protein ATN84_20105 [Paramesorhizobium deserti]|uniref:Uncharacterized protein n=1 Tax=Paramesorhizobium deserti TaxID=1494590 RepID=A0A135HP55_9HYPH|nr:Ig-like domain-containing protein [Paramesorhizobium deserti]KXF74997.1 hypothetical protein ATN84_20105 [Paramesorhizobium deserti]